MQTLLPEQLDVGMVILYDNTPHRIEGTHVSGTAKTKHKLHVRLRHLHNGHVSEQTLQENVRIPVLDVEQRLVQFSYRTGDQFIFNDIRTYDEFALSAAQIGDRVAFLTENQEYRAVFLDGKLVDVTFPEHVPLKVLETAPPQRKSQTSTLKPAKLEGGLEVMVPPFIAPGDVIDVDTATRRYVGKAS